VAQDGAAGVTRPGRCRIYCRGGRRAVGMVVATSAYEFATSGGQTCDKGLPALLQGWLASLLQGRFATVGRLRGYHGAAALLRRHGASELLPWRVDPAAMARRSCYHDAAELLPLRGGAAPMARRRSYIDAAELLPWRGGAPPVARRCCYIDAAELLPWHGGAAAMARWCYQRPTALLAIAPIGRRRCSHKRDVLLSEADRVAPSRGLR
jgi:hypothetical protein